MNKKILKLDQDMPGAGYRVEFLQALNAAAASLQQSAHSEAEVFQAFREQITGLGLRGGLSLLNKTSERLTVRVVAYPSQKLLTRVEKLTSLKIEGFEFSLAKVDAYKQVIQTGEALFMDNNSPVITQLLPKPAQPFAARILKFFGSLPVIFAPLIARKQVHGVLNILGPDLTPEDVPAIIAFANHIAIALDNAQLVTALQQSELRLQQTNNELVASNESLQHEVAERERAENEIRRRNQELSLLNRIIASSAATPSSESEAMLETICHELALAFNVPQTAVILLNKQKTMMTVVAEHLVDSQPTIQNDNMAVKDNPAAQYLLNHKGPLAIADTQNDLRLGSVRGLANQGDIASLLYVPLIVKNEVIGILCLETIEPHTFSTGEINLAWSIADQVAGVLARIRLSEAHLRLNAAIEQAAESVVITDTEGTILYVNPAFERLTGYKQAEAIGQNPRILKSGKQDAAFYQEMWAKITSGQVWHGRLVNRKKDGTLYTEEGSITPVHNENGDIVNYVCVKRDVTHELQLEEQYQQSQKMEAVGRLTAGIAHDFNNLLLVINGFAELMQYQLSSDDPLQEMLGKILDSGKRAADLVRQLLAFSRKQIVEPKILNLNEIVANMDQMLQRIIGEDIEMVASLSPDLWSINIDPSQIEQIIVNLVINARDATPYGGQLTIETANVILDEEYSATHLEAQPGEYVLLAVSDTGVGMSEGIQAQIFEPFFTTKEEGKGSGLGLAMVFGIVRQNGGNIWVYSEKGQGTTFKIYLPRIKEDAPSLSHSEIKTEMPFGSETILLVEDDANVRVLAQGVLQRQGYTLLEAQDAQEALQVSSQYSDTIHLLLTDVIMPGMSGKTLAEYLCQTRPELKVLFMSGYTDNAIVHHGVLNPGVAFIQKPFSPLVLTYKVREVLDS